MARVAMCDYSNTGFKRRPRIVPKNGRFLKVVTPSDLWERAQDARALHMLHCAAPLHVPHTRCYRRMTEQHAAVLAKDPMAVPLIDYAQLNPLKGIPGLLDQTISVVNEKMAAMQVCTYSCA